MGQKNQLWWDLPASDSFYLNKCIFDVPDGEYRRTAEKLSELLDVKDLMNVQVRRLSLGDRKLLYLKSIEPVPREHLSLFGRVREYHGREAVLEVPKGKIKETASAILSLLPGEDFTVTEIPLEESIALFFQKEVTAL